VRGLRFDFELERDTEARKSAALTVCIGLMGTLGGIPVTPHPINSPERVLRGDSQGAEILGSDPRLGAEGRRSIHKIKH
jgi:hypothetical protein